MAVEKSPFAFGDFSGDELQGLYSDESKAPVEFVPPPSSAALPINSNSSGKSSSGCYSNSREDTASPVFNFAIATTNERDNLHIQFGSSPVVNERITPPRTSEEEERDSSGKPWNVNASEFIPSSQSSVITQDKMAVEMTSYPSNPSSSSSIGGHYAHSLPPPAAAAVYYPYIPHWVDPRYVPFFQPFHPHGYRFPAAYPGPHPQVAVVAPYRTMGDVRPPSVRVSEETVRGSDYSVPDVPPKGHAPLSPSSISSPPSFCAQGDSGIDLGQSNSVSPPSPIQPTPTTTTTTTPDTQLLPSFTSDSVHTAAKSTAGETTPKLENTSTNNNDVTISHTTPTHNESTPTKKKDSSSSLSNEVPVVPNSTQISNEPTLVSNTSSKSEGEQEDPAHLTTPTVHKATDSNKDNVPGSKPVKRVLPLSTTAQTKTASIKPAPTKNESRPLNTANLKTTPTGNDKSRTTSTSTNTETTPTCLQSTVEMPSSSIAQSPLATPSTNLATETTPSSANTTTPTAATPTANAWSKKSWASIVGSSNGNSTSITTTTAKTSKGQELTTKSDPSLSLKKQEDTVGASKGEPPILSKEAKSQLKVLGGRLKACPLSHDPVSLVPRGLRNSGSLCYVHAPLQALVTCPAFYHLFKSIKSSPTTATFTDSMVQFVNYFKVYPRDTAYEADGKISYKKKKPLIYEEPFQPEFIYDLLTESKSCLSVKGRHEDAEEFLCWILGKLHDEMVSAMQMLDPVHTSTVKDEELSEDEEEWQEVGPKNKSTITRRMSCEESPISSMFGGKIQSTLHRQGMKETVTVEPFFSLQLDIQSNDIHSIKEALEMLCVRENIILTNSNNKEESATRKITLAELPHYLILHIKRFYFDGSTTHKIVKPISYDQDLEISKDLLSSSSRGRISPAQRNYKLWAVISHQGKTVDKGHYICDVYHSATSSWIRVNDNYVKMVPADYVFNPFRGPSPHVPYLLFYRQSDSSSRRL